MHLLSHNRVKKIVKRLKPAYKNLHDVRICDGYMAEGNNIPQFSLWRSSFEGKNVYTCQNCGYQSAKWLGKCLTATLEFPRGETQKSGPLSGRFSETASADQ
jgi:hypothetical protein